MEASVVYFFKVFSFRCVLIKTLCYVFDQPVFLRKIHWFGFLILGDCSVYRNEAYKDEISYTSRAFMSIWNNPLSIAENSFIYLKSLKFLKFEVCGLPVVIERKSVKKGWIIFLDVSVDFVDNILLKWFSLCID